MISLLLSRFYGLEDLSTPCLGHLEFSFNFCLQLKWYEIPLVYIGVQECIPVRCAPSAAVVVCPGGVYLGGVSSQEGVSAGGCLPRGVYTPPCGQTGTCENTTFPQLLLRTVKMCTLQINGTTFKARQNHKYGTIKCSISNT